MKKVFLILAMLLVSKVSFASPITVDQFITPEDVSIAHLENFRTQVVDAINSADGSLLQAESVTTAALNDNANPEKRWYYSFNSFVYSGLLPPTTSGTLTSTTTAGVALIKNDDDEEMKLVAKDATAKTYTATKWTFVDLSSNGTYTYQEVAIGASEPSTTTNSIRLARVSTDATQVSAVRDDRVTSIQLTTNEDNYREGLTISVTTPDTITISPGIIYHGTTRVSKTSDSSLNIGTAADWVGGASGRATSTMGFVVVDSAGNVKLFTTAPTKTDTSGNANGKLRYSLSGSTYYRVLAWFYMNATGSGNIEFYNYGNFPDGEISATTLTRDSLIATTSASLASITDTAINFYSAGGWTDMYFTAPFYVSNNAGTLVLSLDVDGNSKNFSQGNSSTASATEQIPLFWSGKLSAGSHTATIKWSISGGYTATQDGLTDGRRIFTIKEY